MEKRNILEIIIESCEFPKEFNYFLTINQEGEGEKVNIIRFFINHK